MIANDNKKKSISLRLSSNLYTHIEQLAKKQNRSLNNFIETTLFEVLEYNEPNELTKTGIKNPEKKKQL